MGSGSEATVKSDGSNLPFKSLGKYLIQRKLGQGGMGTVYLAKHTELKKLIALKVLPQDKAENPTLVRRFKAEAQAAAQLEHPNIVAVYDTGEADGYLYIAMEFVDGIDLFEQVKRRGVIPVKRSIDIIKQVAAALQEASEKNIVHRDIKPSNLLLRQDGVVKVTDLGLARSIDDTLETNITRAGTTVGTVDYMAPEQARNSKAADIRSDIYSLGCTWYQMLTGQPPFPEGSLTNKLQAHALKPLPDPRELNEKVPEGVFAILQRMTAKKPEDRHQTPTELLDDLNTSKLTKAAFSNEIFSDLSDYELTATQKFIEEDLSDEIDVVPQEVIPQEDSSSRKKSRSRVEDDSAEILIEPVRQKKKTPREDDEPAVTDAPSRRKVQPRESETNASRANETSPSRANEPNNSRVNETSPLDDTQPLKSKRKTSSKTRTDDDEPTSGTPNTKRVDSPTAENKSDELNSPKRKRIARDSDEIKPASLKTANHKNGKATAASGPNETKGGFKSLPPKSEQPTPTTPNGDERVKFNFGALRNLAIALGALVVIVGLGVLISRWSNQIDVLPNPIVNSGSPVPTVEPVIPPVNRNDNSDTLPTTVSVVDAPKPNALDRPFFDYDMTKTPMPAWAASDAGDPRDLAAFSVGPGIASPTHFSNLDEGLRAVAPSGGILRLVGNGPFLLSRVELAGAKRVVIAAANPHDQPLIILRSDESGNMGALTMSHGTLDLRGVHFVLDRTANLNPAPRAIISVSDGQLYVRNCSFTATGQDANSTSAFAFTSTQASQTLPTTEPNVLLDRVTIRGNGLTALQVHRVNADVVIQDSLLVTGTAPAIDIAGHMNPGASEVTLQKPRRTIRVVRTTFCARKQVFELGADGVSKPPTTAILIQDSVCSAEGSGNSTVLASATKWPSVTSTSSGWLTNLHWTSLSSLYLGFDRLLDLDKSSFKVTDLDSWQRVWGKKFGAHQFQPILWQESTIADLSSAMPHDFDPLKLPYHDVKTGAGGLPGCPTNLLQVPEVISQTRLAAISQRPKLPAIVLKPADGSPVKKVDLAKEDLGLLLNRNDWQSGTVFEASGAGIRFMSPTKISGKSVRIVFRQIDGPALKLQPKVVEQKSKPDSTGLFNIENGLLDIQSVVLETSQSVRPATPPWLISAKNASVIIRDSQLHGPLLQDLEQHQGLIQWSTTSPATTAVGAELPFLSINNSMLLSPGIGIRAECTQGSIFLRNSILAVRGCGINLLPVRSDDKLSGNLDLEHVTFSTTNASIRIQAAAGENAVSSPMRLFVDYCAFVPPLEFKPGDGSESAIMECVGPVRDQKQIEWWSNSNGVAKDVKTMLRQSGTDAITSASGWLDSWGESNVIRFLTGAKGVLLNTVLPNKWGNLKATSFALDSKSIGATWADGGRPVGADTRVIENALLAKKAPETKPANPNGPTQNNQPKVNAKKDIGF